MRGGYPIISADSHITEAPNTYIDFIDPAYRDRAPKLVDGGEQVGDIYVIDGMKRPVPMGLVAAAGKPAEEIRFMGVRFDDLHRSGWDPAARLADQRAPAWVFLTGMKLNLSSTGLRNSDGSWKAKK